ncbi:MAG: GTPase [Pirellulales bacterium]
MTLGPYAVVLTPRGRGAVASLLVAGQGAEQVVAGLFRAAGSSQVAVPIGRIQFGHWARSPREQVVVCHKGPDQVEVHCHGGTVAAQVIADSLVEAGCRLISWHAWCAGSQADPLAAEAQQALALARTERAAAILLDQFHGALSGELREIADLLEAGSTAGASRAAGRLRQLAAWKRLGSHLTRPFRVVLAGRPNVGKSSLINALVGYPRAIVFDQPGTTRDIVTASTALEGWPVELADTAGLAASSDPLETSGMRLAIEHFSTADARVLVFDASRPWSKEDDDLAARWPDAIIVHNKSDLPPPGGPVGPAGVSTSAVVEGGAGSLACALVEHLVPEAPAAGAPVPFNDRQMAAIEQGLADLERGNGQQAATDLRRLLSQGGS